jgi:TetR/AcrR family transcriptional repressor of nem operon
MGRVSRAEAARHRDEVVEAAARLFRQRGVDGVSVADLMAEVGLTHGGFYRQFASKEALAGEAASSASQQLSGAISEILDRHHDDREAARKELVDSYLSVRHRDNPGSGCPLSALNADAARSEAKAPLRAAYVRSVEGFVDKLSFLDTDRDDRIATLCTLVGALVLSRATVDDNDLSEEILSTVRAKLAS